MMLIEIRANPAQSYSDPKIIVEGLQTNANALPPGQERAMAKTPNKKNFNKEN